jgi:hypothetical protein
MDDAIMSSLSETPDVGAVLRCLTTIAKTIKPQYVEYRGKGRWGGGGGTPISMYFMYGSPFCALTFLSLSSTLSRFLKEPLAIESSGEAKKYGTSEVMDAWLDRAENCRSIAGVQLLYHMLDDCIRWELSAEAATQQVGGEEADEERMGCGFRFALQWSKALSTPVPCFLHRIALR